MEARFSAHIQTGPGAHTAYYTMGTGPFPEVKRPGRGVDHPPTSRAEIKERVQLYLYSNLGLRGLSRVNVIVTFALPVEGTQSNFVRSSQKKNLPGVGEV